MTMITTAMAAHPAQLLLGHRVQPANYALFARTSFEPDPSHSISFSRVVLLVSDLLVPPKPQLWRLFR